MNIYSVLVISSLSIITATKSAVVIEEFGSPDALGIYALVESSSKADAELVCRDIDSRNSALYSEIFETDDHSESSPGWWCVGILANLSLR